MSIKLNTTNRYKKPTEKVSPDLESWEQSFEYLEQQGYEIQFKPSEFAQVQDFGIEERKGQTIIRFPRGRDFTLEDEVQAINTITEDQQGQLIINFKHRTITIIESE